MPYQITVEGHGFLVEMSGNITFEEIAEANDKLIAHESWDSHTYQIWSFAGAAALLEDKRSSRVISKVDGMSLDRTHHHRIKIAFVSNNSKTNEFLVSYIDSVDKNLIEGQIFQAEIDARDWVTSKNDDQQFRF